MNDIFQTISEIVILMTLLSKMEPSAKNDSECRQTFSEGSSSAVSNSEARVPCFAQQLTGSPSFTSHHDINDSCSF